VRTMNAPSWRTSSNSLNGSFFWRNPSRVYLSPDRKRNRSSAGPRHHEPWWLTNYLSQKPDQNCHRLRQVSRHHSPTDGGEALSQQQMFSGRGTHKSHPRHPPDPARCRLRFIADGTLEHPRCSFQPLKARTPHASRAEGSCRIRRARTIFVTRHGTLTTAARESPAIFAQVPCHELA